MSPGSAPFIIHGPFGTGKTTTLVEAIQQLYARDNNVRILACAPSNSAADNIATRLQNIGKSNLLRLNDAAREYETIRPSDLKLFHANFGLLGPDPGSDEMRFRYPDYQTLLKYKIVVTTCVTARVPAGLGVKPGHFDWIFIDEAGQVAEPEVPIIQSPISKSLGHCKSYLLRLMETEMYNEKGTMGQLNVTIVKLRHNFRNHPAILQFSNIQFYSGDLEAGADPRITTRVVGWFKMPNPKFPIKFRGIVGNSAAKPVNSNRLTDPTPPTGRDQYENKSLSWFNGHENKGYTGPPLDPRWDANEEVDFTVPDFYDPKRQQEHASNMESLERRIKRAVLRQQGLEAEDRDSDEEDEVVYVSKGEGAGRANNI
ncbi:hypothetical protein FRC00_005409 [Tulasnella sp. 408]|nr:hypothetical protein FRC00_005409 [Tulasnella sp. 408]